MTPAQKNWIDNATYFQLLERWRFAPVGDVMFQGEVGEYYSKVMHEKKAKEADGGVSVSKAIGWER